MKRAVRYAAPRPPPLGIDAGQPDIVAGLEGIGAGVTSLAKVRIPGVPDLLVSWRGTWTLMEVKSPLGKRGGKTRDGQRLRDSQVTWAGKQRAPVHVVRSLTDALEAIGAQRSRAQEARS